MVLKKIRIFLRIIFLCSLIAITSCEEHGLIVNCQDCVTDEPEFAEIEIKLDINYYGTAAIITIYEGNLEDGVVLKEISISGTNAKTSVRVNKKYTFTVLYYFPDNYYTAVDSATPRISYNKDQCDDPCYFVYDKEVNLRLKYTK